MIGGSLATAASAGRDCARKIAIRVPQPKTVALADGPSIDPLLDHWVIDIAETANVNEETARAIVDWHGKRSKDIACMARSSVEWRTPICAHSRHIVAAVHAYVNEFAVTLGDVLLPRVPVALGSCWSDSCSREADLRIAAVLGWNDQTTGANIEALEMERAAFLRKAADGRADGHGG